MSCPLAEYRAKIEEIYEENKKQHNEIIEKIANEQKEAHNKHIDSIKDAHKHNLIHGAILPIGIAPFHGGLWW